MNEDFIGLQRKISDPNKYQLKLLNNFYKLHLYTLLCQISAGARRHLGDHQPIADGLDCAVHSYDAPSALCTHVQVVRDGASCHLQYVVWRTFVQEDLTQRRQKRTWWTAGKSFTVSLLLLVKYILPFVVENMHYLVVHNYFWLVMSIQPFLLIFDHNMFIFHQKAYCLKITNLYI